MLTCKTNGHYHQQYQQKENISTFSWYEYHSHNWVAGMKLTYSAFVQMTEKLISSYDWAIRLIHFINFFNCAQCILYTKIIYEG